MHAASEKGEHLRFAQGRVGLPMFSFSLGSPCPTDLGQGLFLLDTLNFDTIRLCD